MDEEAKQYLRDNGWKEKKIPDDDDDKIWWVDPTCKQSLNSLKMALYTQNKRDDAKEKR